MTTSQSSDSEAVTYSDLTDCAETMSTTMLAIIETALVRLLGLYCGQDDIVFGTVLSGRNIGSGDMSQTVGPCFNTLPVRTHIRQNTTNIDLCRALQDYNIDMLQFQPSSLRKALKSGHETGQISFDVLLLLQTATAKLDPEVWSLVSESGHMDFPFILEVVPEEPAKPVDIKLHCSTETWKDSQDVLLAEIKRTILIGKCRELLREHERTNGDMSMVAQLKLYVDAYDEGKGLPPELVHVQTLQFLRSSIMY